MTAIRGFRASGVKSKPKAPEPDVTPGVRLVYMAGNGICARVHFRDQPGAADASWKVPRFLADAMAAGVTESFSCNSLTVEGAVLWVVTIYFRATSRTKTPWITRWLEREALFNEGYALLGASILTADHKRRLSRIERKIVSGLGWPSWKHTPEEAEAMAILRRGAAKIEKAKKRTKGRSAPTGA